MKKILLVEDSIAIVKGLTYLLEKEYIVEFVHTKKDALEKLKNIYDLVILDIGLPDGSGFDIVSNCKNIPIIFLTANDLEQDIIKGLSHAEDYVVKPFRNGELLVRINKVLQRNDTSRIYYKNITIDTNKSLVYVDDNQIDFTSLEYSIVLLLFSNLDHIITRDRILSVIWDENNKYVNDNTLSVNIKRIRQKLIFDYIKTIKGMGYMVSTNNND